jgi:hypothetical protein
MIKITPENSIKIHDMFVAEHRHNKQCIVDTIDLIKLFNTYDVKDSVLGKSFAYWEFMHACIDNIATNRWRTLPRMWIEYCCISRDTPMLPFQVDAEYRRYLAHRERVLSNLGLPTASHQDKQVLLHWVRNKRSEQYMLGIAHAILRIYLYHTQSEFSGINNNTAKPTNSFDTADQAIEPLEGDNKNEILEYNFKTPYTAHEKMV